MAKFDETTLRELTWDNLKAVAKVSVGRLACVVRRCGVWRLTSSCPSSLVLAGERRARRAEAREDHGGAAEDREAQDDPAVSVRSRVLPFISYIVARRGGGWAGSGNGGYT